MPRFNTILPLPIKRRLGRFRLNFTGGTMVLQLIRKNGLVVFSIFAVLLTTVFILSQGCSPKASKPVIWIYTSLYPDVIQEFSKKLEAKFPEVEVKWYQAGSENVAAKLNAEILAGKPKQI